MSVFNATYENLLTDGYITLTELSSVIYYIKLLEQDEFEYQITRRFCWYDNTVEFLVKILNFEDLWLKCSEIKYNNKNK